MMGETNENMEKSIYYLQPSNLSYAAAIPNQSIISAVIYSLFIYPWTGIQEIAHFGGILVTLDDPCRCAAEHRHHWF